MLVKEYIIFIRQIILLYGLYCFYFLLLLVYYLFLTIDLFLPDVSRCLENLENAEEARIFVSEKHPSNWDN